MFSLEIDFHDGISPPETILVRRSSAVIGSSEFAHVVIEGAASGLCELRLTRGLGREFSCQPVRKVGQPYVMSNFIEGVYCEEAELRLGEVTAFISALDLDLQVFPDESPDRAGVRVLASAINGEIPVFPAVAVLGGVPAYVSFPESHALIIGRSRKCGLRLDASDVSGEHARVGLEDGQFWVEDLGSTNGTFVGTERVAGRRYLARDDVIRIGAEFTLALVAGTEDVTHLNSRVAEVSTPVEEGNAYPCIVSCSDLIRPSRCLFGVGDLITVGRDPANDIWIGAPHVSRRHLEISRNSSGELSVVDTSSNGTFLGEERLVSGSPIVLGKGLTVLNLCSGVVLAVCYSEEDERSFFASYGGGSEMSPSPDIAFEIGDRTEPALPAVSAGEIGEPSIEMRSASGSVLLNDANGGSVFQELARRQGNRAVFFPGGSETAGDSVLKMKADGHGEGGLPFDVDYDEDLNEPLLMGRFRLLGLIVGMIVVVFSAFLLFLNLIGGE